MRKKIRSIIAMKQTLCRFSIFMRSINTVQILSLYLQISAYKYFRVFYNLLG